MTIPRFWFKQKKKKGRWGRHRLGDIGWVKGRFAGSGGVKEGLADCASRCTHVTAGCRMGWRGPASSGGGAGKHVGDTEWTGHMLRAESVEASWVWSWWN